GMGGFASAPGGLAAKLAGIPVVVHEQNAAAGRANRLLCKVARQTLTGFPNALPGGRWVGNPARAEFFVRRPKNADAPRRLLVLGGSQGAQIFNQTVPAALARLPGGFTVAHQCGRGNLPAVRRAYDAAGRDAEICEFMDDVAARMMAADLVVSRAGAATLAELAAAAAAAFLVPYPHAGGHQRHNAAFFTEKGAAFSCEERDFGAEKLAAFFAAMTRPMLADAARRAGELARPDAAAAVAEACLAEAKHAP
ncbi:MAG: UDP-N-acetylglucosamine--N-acetylmuramyl-(pentapeptide) pyrophosphoryl-undecaprenol N-acetylglucosamine transferase, partial [Betaproteobacteria bacterium]|nr:UDP-N-acetylglucosamine--N-acetylmuramyl-(pentapeptide) pyrophosphoryl-undecaprenol N-acetylglucosamine transferase [Betaproteobacteria bacterium]